MGIKRKGGLGSTKNVIFIGLIMFTGYVTRNVWGPLLHQATGALDKPSATQLISGYARSYYVHPAYRNGYY